MKTFIILPHQLFNYKHLDKTKKIVLNKVYFIILLYI